MKFARPAEGQKSALRLASQKLWAPLIKSMLHAIAHFKAAKNQCFLSMFYVLGNQVVSVLMILRLFVSTVFSTLGSTSNPFPALRLP